MGHTKTMIFVQLFKVSLEEYFLATSFYTFKIEQNSLQLKPHLEDFIMAAKDLEAKNVDLVIMI